MKIGRAEGGRSRVTMPVTPETLQLYGQVHGGAIATLLDGAMGAAVQSTLEEGEATVTLELHSRFVRPTLSGTLHAEGQVLKRGRSVILCDCRVQDDAGNLIALGDASFMVLEATRWGKAGG